MSSIELKNVCVDYIVKSGTESLKRAMINACRSISRKGQNDIKLKTKHTSFRALNNISLDINKGDRVGLVGRNGAGKSTMLRVIAKIYQPTFGTIKINGDISNLFDLNLGINIEATGYENIVNLGIMRGWSKKQAYGVISEIEDFTELGDFLDKPVSGYSTGMQMKLAFAVATAFPPEIVLIDEIIGTGDAHFMKKATNRIMDMIDKSHILVLTSHANDIIKKFCNKVVVLDHGEIKFFGDCEEGLNFYEKNLIN